MFEKAIEIIMSEPPEARYPSYYASLLRKADVPDKDVGKCSEIPNSSDTISRQDAIDALSEAGLINYAATGDGNGMIQAVNVIKGLPSAQQWIPCSERLPEGFGEYLVTKKTIGWKCVEYNSIDIAYFDNEGFHKAHKVLAWMPLPEPYRG